MKHLGTLLRRSAPTLVVLAGAALESAAQRPGAPRETSEDDTPRTFALPLVRDAWIQAEETREHLAAARHAEAISLLQAILEDFSAAVLPREYAAKRDRPSREPNHPGAADWALATLLRLPAEAQGLYRERYEREADLALGHARASFSRRGLVDVARRYPLTESAVLAWWSLGDLEFESGSEVDARRAWRAARLLAATSGVDLDLASAVRDERSTQEDRSALAHGPVGVAESWAQPLALDLTPFGPGEHGLGFPLIPAFDEAMAYVSSSLVVYAIDAFTGELAWRSDLPKGWSQLSASPRRELFQGVRGGMHAPAIADGWVVAALQIPWAEDPNDDWQQIEIRKSIPERRLHAFDRGSGALIWSHAPLLRLAERERERRFVFDRDSASYAERMLVAAPPAIAGSRVLVPCYRMQGRIDYHVACYELETGDLLWSTLLVSGQREKNMFGRSLWEFAAPPLVVADERVVAQTDLGVVAALDLDTGRILWETLYEQLDLPPSNSYSARPRALEWRMSPPIVEAGVVLATPTDSPDLVGIDLADGRLLWSESQRELARRDRRTQSYDFDQLVGARDDTIYLAGAKVAALVKPGGLSSASAFQTRWTQVPPFDSRPEPPDYPPRALLLADGILVPLPGEPRVFELASGEPLRGASTAGRPEDYGNVAAGQGFLLTLGRGSVNGYFDWETLVARERQTLVERPGDPATRTSLAELLLRRARSLVEHAEHALALDTLAEVGSLLEPLLAADPDSRAPRDVLFESLRLEARAREHHGPITAAFAPLERAQVLAPSPEALALALLQEERLAAECAPERRVRILAELFARCPGVALPMDPGLSADWLVGEALVDVESLDGWERARLPVGLYALLTSADLAARGGEVARALEDLHRALELYGDLELVLGLRVGQLLRARIERRIELDGEESYAVFEARAEELYQRASATGDLAGLAAVGELYPLSRAARRAREEQLSRAFAAADLELLASIAESSLTRGRTPTSSDAAILRRLARLASAGGNAEFERGVLMGLGRDLPLLVSDLPEDAGLTFAELARREAGTGTTSALASFGPSLTSAARWKGSLVPLGLLDGTAGSGGPWCLFLDAPHSDGARGHLLAFAAEPPGELAFDFPLDFEPGQSRCVLAGDRMLFAHGGSIEAFAPHGRAPLWKRVLGEAEIVRLVLEEGVVLALVGRKDQPTDRTHVDRVVALEAHAGLMLWERSLPRGAGRWSAVAGDGRVALLELVLGRPSRALAVDLARGAPMGEIALGVVSSTLDESAWIQDGLLLVPTMAFGSFGDETALSAYDLESSEQAWRVSFPRGEELIAVADHAGASYLVTVASQIEKPAPSGGIYAVDLVVGGVRRIEELEDPHETVLGLAKGKRTRLDQPFLFVLDADPAARTAAVRAVHLPFRTRWVAQLSVSSAELHPVQMLPRPIVSESSVAIAYVVRSKNSRDHEVRMTFVDPTTGVRQGTRTLGIKIKVAMGLELRALGATLFALARSSQNGQSELEILAEVR